MILFSLRCLFFVHNLYKLININLIIIISISFLHKSSHLCLCYLPCKSRFYLSLHFYKTHYHAIPGSNQIFQHWAGSRKKSDTFAQKYMMQIENNACTRHLWKSTLIYKEIHPHICYWSFDLQKKHEHAICQKPNECQPIQPHILFVTLLNSGLFYKIQISEFCWAKNGWTACGQLLKCWW